VSFVLCLSVFCLCFLVLSFLPVFVLYSLSLSNPAYCHSLSLALLLSLCLLPSSLVCLAFCLVFFVYCPVYSLLTCDFCRLSQPLSYVSVRLSSRVFSRLVFLSSPCPCTAKSLSLLFVFLSPSLALSHSFLFRLLVFVSSLSLSVYCLIFC
jgi:hypothetical protein